MRLPLIPNPTTQDNTMTTLNYIDPPQPLTYAPLWWHDQGLTQTATGYGGKLTTPYKAMHNGRLYRVYCMCYSNSGTNYIISKGQRLIIR